MPSKAHPIASSEGSVRDMWATPPEVCELIEAFAAGPVDLDPCAALHSPLLAHRKCYGPRRSTQIEVFGTAMPNEDDGLEVPWCGIVYVNPPYSAPEPWVRRCADERQHCAAVIAMLRCDPSVRWFEHVWRAHALCFPRRRIQFAPPPGVDATQNTGPNVLALWLSSRLPTMERHQRFARIFRQIGPVILLPGGAW